jgi:starch phosphorylase
MKLQLNGALTIGTLDGANVEILEEVGEENIFIFGLTAEEVELRRPLYNPWEIYHGNEEIRRAVQLIDSDFFSMTEPGIFKPLVWTLLDGGDRYMLLADLQDYIRTQERVDDAYQDRAAWCTKAIANVARAGRFSSDRTISEYASQIWHLEPCQIAPVREGSSSMPFL